MTNAITQALKEIRERAKKATPNPELHRYEHGGGRSMVLPDGTRDDRVLVADYYHEGDREFYHAARSDVPALLDALEIAVNALEKIYDGRRSWQEDGLCKHTLNAIAQRLTQKEK